MDGECSQMHVDRDSWIRMRCLGDRHRVLFGTPIIPPYLTIPSLVSSTLVSNKSLPLINHIRRSVKTSMTLTSSSIILVYSIPGSSTYPPSYLPSHLVTNQHSNTPLSQTHNSLTTHLSTRTPLHYPSHSTPHKSGT